MRLTKVAYEDGVLTIQYPTHTRVCRDIRSTRIELKRIINYRGTCSEKDFFHYAALADRVKYHLDQMIVEEELKRFGDTNAAYTYC